MEGLNCTLGSIAHNMTTWGPCLQQLVSNPAVPSLSTVVLPTLVATAQGNPLVTVAAITLSGIASLGCVKKIFQGNSFGAQEGFFTDPKTTAADTTQPVKNTEQTVAVDEKSAQSKSVVFRYVIPGPSRLEKVCYAGTAVVLSGLSGFLSYATFFAETVAC